MGRECVRPHSHQRKCHSGYSSDFRKSQVGIERESRRDERYSESRGWGVSRKGLKVQDIVRSSLLLYCLLYYNNKTPREPVHPPACPLTPLTRLMCSIRACPSERRTSWKPRPKTRDIHPCPVPWKFKSMLWIALTTHRYGTTWCTVLST